MKKITRKIILVSIPAVFVVVGFIYIFITLESKDDIYVTETVEDYGAVVSDAEQVDESEELAEESAEEVEIIEKTAEIPETKRSVPESAGLPTTSLSSVDSEATTTPTPPPDKPKEDLISATLNIEGSSYSLDIEEDSSVYDLLNLADEKYGIGLRGRSFEGLGFFVDSLNGKKSSQKSGMYWIYYVNGSKSNIGATGYILKEGDIVSWKYEREK